MAEEKNFGKLHGLCNAVILAEKESKYLQIWLKTYKNFRSKGKDRFWAEHSVRVPFRIAKNYPSLIHVEPEVSFFFPSYSYGLDDLFVHCSKFPKAYLFHLWESLSYDNFLKPLNEQIIKSEDTTYNVIARKYL